VEATAMRFGLCTTVDNSLSAKESGWDYIEAPTPRVLNGMVKDEQWSDEPVKESALPVRSANLLLPDTLKVTGPKVIPPALRLYMERLTRRAKQIGITTLVFDSGPARWVPDGFDRNAAKRQLIDFGKLCGELAEKVGGGVTIVLDPLNRRECNIINTIPQAMEIVRAVSHPNFQCMLDTYHFWIENEPLENLVAAIKSIRHIHVADKDGRAAPGETGNSSYQPIFAALRKLDYRGTVSANAPSLQPFGYFTVAEYLKTQWKRADLGLNAA
jgi:sugar phosphate isomerase/epimerase